MSAPRGVFVTATDTEVGKTYLSAVIAAALRASGLRVAAAKPVLSGLDDPGPHDHELLAAATGQAPEAVAPRRFGPAVSPHLAAELARERLDVAALAATVRATGEDADALVVEGVGGLLVPLGGDATVRDLARELGFPVVVAARPGLGTINHTLLTLEAATGLDVRAVVLTPWPAAPSALERSNAETIAALGGVPVHTLGVDASADDLPLSSWLGYPSAATLTIDASMSHSTGATSSV